MTRNHTNWRHSKSRSPKDQHGAAKSSCAPCELQGVGNVDCPVAGGKGELLSLGGQVIVQDSKRPEPKKDPKKIPKGHRSSKLDLLNRSWISARPRAQLHCDDVLQPMWGMGVHGGHYGHWGRLEFTRCSSNLWEFLTKLCVPIFYLLTSYLFSDELNAWGQRFKEATPPRSRILAENCFTQLWDKYPSYSSYTWVIKIFFRPFFRGIDVFFFSGDLLAVVFLSSMNCIMVIKRVIDGYPISYRQPKSDTI